MQVDFQLGEEQYEHDDREDKERRGPAGRWIWSDQEHPHGA
nr:hypothetical protein [Bradyrhizobium diazoefficiens]